MLSFATTSRTAAGLALVAGATSLTTAAQPGAGAKYGTRDPVACTQGVGRGGGAPTAAQVAQLVRCEQWERPSYSTSALTLAENFRVEVGRPRPYQHVADSYDNIDVRQPLYEIRGAFTLYTCWPISATEGMITGPGTRAERGDNRGRNCQTTEQPRATGKCYRDTFGDLHCFLADHNVPLGAGSGPVPPPR